MHPKNLSINDFGCDLPEEQKWRSIAVGTLNSILKQAEINKR